MTETVPPLTYAGIFLALIARGIGVPIPEDIPLLTGGFLCARQICRLEWMLPVAWSGVLVADGFSFGMGRMFRGHLPRLPVLRLVFSPRRMRRAERFYRRHGVKGLLAARFMPGLRTPLFFMAGTAGLSPARFILIDMAMAVFSVGLLVGLGRYFPTRLNRIHDLAVWYQWAGLILAVLLLMIISWKVYKNQGRRAGSPDE
ncbi:MAG: DedA family protein [Desulfosudaceae bacterium]